MLRWIVNSSLKFRHLVVVAAAMLMFFGALAVRDSPVDAFPEFAPPRVEVQTLCLGLSAKDVEQLVTVPMEETLNGIEGIDVLRSRSVSQLSTIQLVFKPGTDLFKARLLVSERVNTISPTLPRWATTPFMISPLSSTSRVMKIGLTPRDQSREGLINMSLAAYWTLRPRLMRVPGVANVAIWGDKWNVLQIQADPARMRKHDVTLNDVMDAAGNSVDVGQFQFTSGFHIGTGGFIDGPNQELGIKHEMPLYTPKELSKAPVVPRRGGTPVTLGDVTTVVRSHQPSVNGEAVINDGPGSMMIVEKLPWGNSLEITRGVEAAIKEMKPGLIGISVDTEIFRPATFIEHSIDNLGRSLFLGFLIVAAIVLLFLFEWRVALISIVTIPLSLVAAALVFHLTGTTINTMILAGLVIALGVIVDDAIIDVENIVRRIRQNRTEGTGRTTRSIVLDASLEVRGPIVNATAIILVCTIPIFLLDGLTGSFFRPLALAYGLAIVASLVVALTVTPALALMLLSKSSVERRSSPLVRWLAPRYTSLLARIINRPRGAYAAVAVLALAGIAVLPLFGQSLLPPFKERDFLMHWVTKPGTSWPEMVRITTRASKELRAIPGVKNFGAHIGQGTLADEPVGMNFGENWIRVDESVDYDKTVAKVQDVVDGYPGLQRDVQTYLKERIKEVITGASEAIVVRIYGDDYDVLRAKSQEVLAAIKDVPGTIDEKADLSEDIPQMEVKVKLAAASRYGIKPGDVRRAAATFVASEEAGDIWRDGKNTEVHVWSTPAARRSLTNVRNLKLDTPDGRRVPISELADVRVTPTPNIVVRQNNSRRIDVGTNVSEGELGSAAQEIEERVKKIDFPRGYHAEVIGEYKEAKSAQERLRLLAIVVVFAILLLLQQAFGGSWRLAFLVLLTLPVALVGGILAGYFDGGVVSIGTIVGFFAVFGIAARNGILMISHFQHLERDEGETFGRELVLRGARERLSPILMTSLATGLALVPLVIAGNIPGHEIEHPMAIVILGGLVTSTVLNLFIVPSLYLRFGRPRTTG